MYEENKDLFQVKTLLTASLSLFFRDNSRFLQMLGVIRIELGTPSPKLSVIDSQKDAILEAKPALAAPKKSLFSLKKRCGMWDCAA